MLQNRSLLGAIMMVGFIAAWVGVWEAPAFPKKAFVEVTGQTTSFADGDDGDLQAGVPFPRKRFVDQRNGTVMDRLTGLIWLKNADCFGGQSWADALEKANTLASGSCGLTDGSKAGDWRLPNVKELQSLIDFGTFSPALPAGHPFLKVQSFAYWSSTTLAGNPGNAWLVNLDGGDAVVGSKDSIILVWPVRGGA